MKSLIAILGMLTMSSIASASGVTSLQRTAAAKINKSAVARREGVMVKPSAIKFEFLNGRHGIGIAAAKSNPGAFPVKVTVNVNGTKLTGVKIMSTAVPGVLY